MGTCILVKDSWVRVCRHVGSSMSMFKRIALGYGVCSEDRLIQLLIRFLYGLMSPDVGLVIVG